MNLCMNHKLAAVLLAGLNTFACNCTAFADALVSLPVFPFEKINKHTAAEDERVVYGSRPSPPLQMRRANNLFAAGHFNEAIREYEKGSDNWNVPEMFRSDIDRNWGAACERVGKIDEAIQHYKTAGADDALAKLYFKLNRYNEAKEIADKQIIHAKQVNAKYHGYTLEYPEWLRLRAAIAIKTNAPSKALTDLESAAKIYYRDDSENSELCAKEANALIANYHLGAAFQLQPDALPQQGKDKIIELVKFIVSAPDPFDLRKLSTLTGAAIKVPGRTWPNVCQIENPPDPFARIEYQADHDDYRVPRIMMITFSTDKCCVPRSEIERIKPANAIDVPALSYWNGSDESPHAEVWKLATTKIRFYFGLAGAGILNKLELEVPVPEKASTAESKLEESRLFTDEQEKKVALLSESIKLDDKNIDALLGRSRAFLATGKFDEALADANRVVAIGGRSFLNDRSIVEERMGNFGSAISDLEAFIGNHEPGPETSTYFVRLAELRNKNQQYKLAIEASNKAMKDTRETAAALFQRAKAKADSQQISAARMDATAAAKQYFEQARIVLRDEVLDWLSRLSGE